MKKLLSALTALMLLLTGLTPALAQEPAAPLTLEAYLAGTEAHAADYGLTLSWTQEPYGDDMTVTICEQNDGKPVLLSNADGTLVAMTTGAVYDPEHPERFNEDFVAALLFAFTPILRAEGLGKEEIPTELANYCNADGFLPGIAQVMQTGEPMAFTFRGYRGEIALLEINGQTLLSLFLVFDEAYFPGNADPVLTNPAAAPEAAADRILTVDYIAGLEALVADYGGTLTWSVMPFSDDLTAHICDTLGGNPTLLSAPDGTLVAISIVVSIDEADLQASFDEYMGAMITSFEIFFRMDGMGQQEALELLVPIVNADGFVPDIIDVITRGGDMTFTFLGYEGVIERIEVDGGSLICMLLVIHPDLFYVK